MKGSRTAAVLVTCALLATSSTHASGPVSLETLMAASIAGNTSPWHTQIRDDSDFEVIDKALEKATDGDWAQHRRPAQLVFMLDLADHAMSRGWLHWLDVLKLGREFVMSRPDEIGRSPADDRLEILWHRAALALIERARCAQCVDDVLHVTLSKNDHPPPLPLIDRVTPRAIDRRTLVDPRIALTAALAFDMAMSGDNDSAAALTRFATDTLTAYASAGAYDEVRGEARVRQARVLLRLDRPGDALKALDEAGELDPAHDAALAYWGRLFRAQALDALGRTNDAKAAYRDALVLAPRAQSPTVALAVLAFRAGDDDAITLARAARTSNADDPWWTYGAADARFYNTWMTEIRAMAKAR